jgi:hypothetical protein
MDGCNNLAPVLGQIGLSIFKSIMRVFTDPNEFNIDNQNSFSMMPFLTARSEQVIEAGNWVADLSEPQW